MRCRVLCVDDSDAITSVLARLMSQEPDLEVVGTLRNADGLAGKIVECQAEVLVLDLAMEATCPLVVIGSIRSACPTCRIVVYSAHDDVGTVDDVMKSGAFDFVSKFAEFGALLTSVRKAAAWDGQVKTNVSAARPNPAPLSK